MNSFHKTRVFFNDYELTEHFVVQNLQRPLAKKNVDLIELAGRDGAIIGNMAYDPVEISMDLVILDESRGIRSEIMRDLAFLFNTDEPKKLQFTDEGSDPGAYYLAVAGGGDIERFVGADRIVGVTFTCPSPAMYGEPKTVTVPSGGSVSFEVGGNFYTMPTITASAVRDTTSLVWGLRLDGGDYIQIATGADAARNIVCDCDNRTLAIAGATALPTLTSDWFVFTPGSHVLQNDIGTGEATVTYTERWL